VAGREAAVRNALVTGAGQGIGRATAERLAHEGYRVVCVDIGGDSAATTAAVIGGESRTCDVRDRAAVSSLAASLEASLGPLDLLVNNAGVWRLAQLADITERDATEVIATNLLGTLWCTQAFAPAMASAGGGAIVNLSSAAATARSPGLGLYPASKAAVEAFTRQMALELGHAGIRVNAVAPGMILTEAAASHPEEGGDKRVRHVPLRRLGDPAEIADAVVFLASDAARYVTGQILYVDGGVSAGLVGA
jgi:3-oxoacyl-[acyl-carrier protein] reductase